MCGIVGVAYRDQRDASSATVRTMCDAIVHRGPDDEGTYVAGPVGLGMRRLSIIDLAGSHQPIFNEDDSKVIVFNGEIYNYKELRNDLLAKGHRFRTSGDTEVILHLFEEYGPRCVERLRGMFAIAIWDIRERSLFLARDRFGIKPLYIVDAPWGLAFASELKALIAAGATSRELDLDALDAFFQIGYIPAPASPFADVRKLEPGHALVWDARRGTRSFQYWDVPAGDSVSAKHAEELVLEALDESVRAHLVSDVPVAAFLSGGMDSSAVVSSMAMAGETPHAFTARYHGTGAESADETGLARLLANRYGAKLTIVDVEPNVTELLEPIVRALDEPHADESAVPTWLVSRAVASSYKVALAGTGGDELFAGYRRHFGLLAGDVYGALPGAARRALSGVIHALPEPRGAGLAVDRAKRFLRTGTGAAPDRLLGYVSRLPETLRRGLWSPSVSARLTGNAAAERFRAVHAAGGSRHGIDAALYLDYKTYLPDDLLALSDRISMALSLEVRVPFVDHVLLDRVYGLSQATKIGRPWKAKRLLRRALRSRLPDEHFRAPKRGFVGPTAAWLRNELRETLTDELSPERLHRLGLFDTGTVSGLLDDHFGRRHNREGILWALLCFSTWHRLNVEQTPKGIEKVA